MKIIVFTFDLLESFIVVFRKSCTKRLENSLKEWIEWLWSEAGTRPVLLKKGVLKNLANFT